MKNKKILWISLIAVDVAITVFLFVVHIIMLAKTVNAHGVTQDPKTLIGWLQNNPTYFFVIICIPVFIIVALDLVYFAIIASRKETNLTNEQLEAIKKKAKEQAQAELMAEIMSEENGEAKPQEEPKAEPQPEEPKAE